MSIELRIMDDRLSRNTYHTNFAIPSPSDTKGKWSSSLSCLLNIHCKLGGNSRCQPLRCQKHAQVFPHHHALHCRSDMLYRKSHRFWRRLPLLQWQLVKSELPLLHELLDDRWLSLRQRYHPYDISVSEDNENSADGLGTCADIDDCVSRMTFADFLSGSVLGALLFFLFFLPLLSPLVAGSKTTSSSSGAAIRWVTSSRSETKGPGRCPCALDTVRACNAKPASLGHATLFGRRNLENNL